MLDKAINQILFLFISDFARIVKPPDKFASRVCGDVDTDSTVELSCPNNTWFRVLAKASSSYNFDSDTDCSSSSVYPNDTQLIGNSAHLLSLVTECRGRQSFEHEDQLCNETIQVPNDINKSDGVQFFEVTYQCVNGKYNINSF